MSDASGKRPVVQSYRRLGVGATRDNPYPTVDSGAVAIEQKTPEPGGPWPEWLNHRMVTDRESMDEFLRLLESKESGGDARARNGMSSATGRFQLLQKTAEAYGMNWERDRFNPQAQFETAKRVTEAYKKQLEDSGFAPTYANLHLAYVAGPTGAKKLLAAPDDTPVAKVLGGGAITANPTLFQGKTAGEVKAWAATTGGMDHAPAGTRWQNGAPLVPPKPPPQRLSIPKQASPFSLPSATPEERVRDLLRRRGLPPGLF